MSTTMYEFWWRRWESMCEQISDTIETMKIEDEPFASLLGKLLNFGSKQFAYFYHGFSETADDTHQKLVIDYAYPPDHVLRVTIDQIAYDYSLIKQAWQQRCGTSSEIETLKLADLWGTKLLEDVVGSDDNNLLDSMPKVISYFHLAPRIRMIPYANVALVGIPLTTMIEDDRRDLLMMGHELAHFIFWNGKIQGKPVKEFMKEIVRGEMPYIKHWREEVFADVFGLAISNQRMVLVTALDMIKDNAPSQYVQDNNIHPIDAVRVGIYLDTIKFMRGENFIDLESTTENNSIKIEGTDGYINNAGLIQAQVREHRKSVGGYDSFWTSDRFGKSVNINLNEARETLRRIIVEIGTIIISPNYGGLDCWRSTIQKSVEKEEENEIVNRTRFSYMISDSKARDERFENTVKEMVREFECTLIKLKLSSSEDNMCKEDIKIIDARSQENRSFIKLRDTHFENSLEPNIWKIIFAADGWALKGPEVGPTGDWESSGDRNSFF